MTGDELGEIYLLSCDCGEVGKLALIGHVRLHQDKVIWVGFSQPHRPSRDYASFGPFELDRTQYEKAVEALVRCTVLDNELGAFQEIILNFNRVIADLHDRLVDAPSIQKS